RTRLTVQEGVVRGHQPARQRKRRIEQSAAGGEVQDPGPELVAHPQIAVSTALQRLRVDVTAGEESMLGALVDDGKPDDVVGIPERDEVAYVNRSRTAARGLEARTNVVGTDQEVGRVGLRAEAVVRHREVFTTMPAAD